MWLYSAAAALSPQHVPPPIKFNTTTWRGKVGTAWPEIADRGQLTLDAANGPGEPDLVEFEFFKAGKDKAD